MGVPRSRLTRSSFQPARAKRLSEWVAFTSSGPSDIAGGAKLVFASFTQAALSGLVPATIIRVRGYLTAKSDQTAAGENWTGAMGIAIVKENARAVGITALPGPVTDAAADMWFYHQFFQGRFSSSTGQGDGFFFGVDVDSKAMRKVEDGDAMVVMAEVGSGVGLSVDAQMRILFLLH